MFLNPSFIKKKISWYIWVTFWVISLYLSSSYWAVSTGLESGPLLLLRNPFTKIFISVVVILIVSIIFPLIGHFHLFPLNSLNSLFKKSQQTLIRSLTCILSKHNSLFQGICLNAFSTPPRYCHLERQTSLHLFFFKELSEK